MYLHILEKFNNDFYVFYNNKIQKVKQIPYFTKSWKYNDHFVNIDDKHIDYINLYTQGNLKNNISANLYNLYKKYNKKINAQKNAYKKTKTQINKTPLHLLIPETLLNNFLNIQQQISQNITENVQKPKNYKHLLKINKIVEHVNKQKLNISLKYLDKSLHNHPKVLTILNNEPYISQDQWTIKTGRLSSLSGYFPINTFDKKIRDILLPNNDYLVELDFNAADIRTSLGLSGHEQPDIDIHEWHTKDKFHGNISRDDVKKDFYSWFYNFDKHDGFYEKYYSREKLKEKYFFNENKIYTDFHRIIETDHEKWFPHLIQSTTSDIFFESCYEVFKKTLTMNSNFLFTNHDSLVLDMFENELEYILELCELFGETKFGKYKVNVSIGKSFGNMERL